MFADDQRRFETPHGIVEYLDVGAGTPTLYFHGTGAGNDAALLLEQSLLKSGCRLIIPNRPGYHATTLGCQGSSRFCADLTADILDRLKINRVVVIGTSGGGMPAACFARCYPDRTAAMVLQCAQSHPWNDGKWLPNGRCPALIIHDRADPLVPFLHAEWSQSCIPESRLLEIHAGGHLIWFGKDADLMNTERVAFIREALRA